ncbi:ABC transporter ATP-binding protein [Pseudarthrobacter sp. J1738]|uniref:ABC transporter ATP-binding protein n=1 Tax=unclassified Pseudarthrobacter TaxID=2647000 RepID=UPI003D2B2D41
MTTQLPLRAAARKLLRRLRPHRRLLLGGIGATVVFVVLNVLAPKLLGDATDLLIPAISGARLDVPPLARLLALVTVMYIAASGASWLQGSLTARAVQRLMFRLRQDVEAKLHRLPVSYFHGESRGTVLSKASDDMDNLAQTLNQTLTQIIQAVIMLVTVLAVMLLVSPVLALVTVLSVPLSLVVAWLLTRRSQKYFAQQWSLTAELNAQVEEDYSALAVLQSHGMNNDKLAKFNQANSNLERASAQAQFVSGALAPLMLVVNNLAYIAVVVVGALQASVGGISIGGIQAFIQFARLFNQPMGQMSSVAGVIQSGLTSASRIFEVLEAQEIHHHNTLEATPAPVRGRVQFHDVSFAFQHDSPLIEHVNFTAEPGWTVAIVGPTGAGKTTLVNLLMGFYEPVRGRITVDGIDIARMDQDDLRSHFGMVLQDAWLFAGSIRDNVQYGRLDASEEDMIEAARSAHVDHFVRALPDGYSTLLGDGGEGISRGQQQLVTIARAHLVNPAVLILDEATSSVDTRTEVQIRQAAGELQRHRTSFVIAHRLATVRDANLILVLDHGKIVEQGTHAQLLENSQLYASLYQSQFSGQDSPNTVNNVEEPRE